MANYAKRALKRLRVSQPLNYLLTSAARGLLRTTGWRSEFFIKHLHRAGIAACDLPNGKTLKLWSRGDDWVSTQIFWRGLHGYEPETALLFLRLAANSSVTLDI